MMMFGERASKAGATAKGNHRGGQPQGIAPTLYEKVFVKRLV